MDTPRKKAFLVMSILLVTLSSSSVGSAAGETKTRWYADMALLQPRDAVAAGAHIYVYDNSLSSNPDSFVAFRIAVMRFDTLWEILEWLEVGYFEDHSGFCIYSARAITGEGYIEAHWAKFNGEGASGESYFDFSIGQPAQNDPNTFQAYMFDPMMGVWSQMEATFTVSGDNLWIIGSESNDPLNTLNGHYASIYYGKNNNLYPWSDTKTSEDAPYHVRMVSANEFFTYSDGLGIGTGHPGSGGMSVGSCGGAVPRKK